MLKEYLLEWCQYESTCSTSGQCGHHCDKHSRGSRMEVHMKQKTILIVLFIVGLIVLVSGCSNNQSNPQNVTGLPNWEEFEVSEQRTELYEKITIVIKEVDSDTKTAIVAVTLPDLEKYLKDGEGYGGATQTADIEFPVQQINGEWQITSIEPIKEYIRSESNRILYGAIESDGGIVIDFDPQEVP